MSKASSLFAGAKTLGKRSEKGQASFEMLLITVVVLSVSLVVLSMWFNNSDETKAIVLLKPKVVEKLSGTKDFYVLRKIEVTQATNTQLDMDLFITPTDFALKEPLVANSIAGLGQGIANATKYSTVNITVRT